MLKMRLSHRSSQLPLQPTTKTVGAQIESVHTTTSWHPLPIYPPLISVFLPKWHINKSCILTNIQTTCRENYRARHPSWKSHHRRTLWLRGLAPSLVWVYQGIPTGGALGWHLRRADMSASSTEGMLIEIAQNCLYDSYGMRVKGGFRFVQNPYLAAKMEQGGHVNAPESLQCVYMMFLYLPYSGCWNLSVTGYTRRRDIVHQAGGYIAEYWDLASSFVVKQFGSRNKNPSADLALSKLILAWDGLYSPVWPPSRLESSTPAMTLASRVFM